MVELWKSQVTMSIQEKLERGKKFFDISLCVHVSEGWWLMRERSHLLFALVNNNCESKLLPNFD